MGAFNTKGEGACLRCCAASTLRWTVQVTSPVIGRSRFREVVTFSLTTSEQTPFGGSLHLCGGFSGSRHYEYFWDARVEPGIRRI